MRDHPAKIERLVFELTEQRVRQLLVELLLETDPKTPAPSRRNSKPAAKRKVTEVPSACATPQPVPPSVPPSRRAHAPPATKAQGSSTSRIEMERR